MTIKTFLASCVVAFQLSAADSIDNVAADFWQWRAREQPVTTDDIPRLERPQSWVPNWSPDALALYRKQLTKFEQQLEAIQVASEPVAAQVDYRLLQSAVARVRWELEVLQLPQRDPAFYVDQTLGAYLASILPPPPFTPERSNELLTILDSIPATIQNAELNLSDARAPFAQIALVQLTDCRTRLQTSVEKIKPLLSADTAAKIDESAAGAIRALESYSQWLTTNLPKMREETAVGKDGYVFFLRQVAVLPYTPEELLAIGRQEWARAVTSQILEEHRNEELPPLRMFFSSKTQIEREAADEVAVRKYLSVKKLLTVPESMAHYRFAAMPDYIKPLADLGEADDFTSPNRLDQNGIRYIDPPSPSLGYFARAMATDPRTLTVHEGVPGHYFQLALSWTNQDPIRRHYYDSCANEGIGYYAEEMMLNAGLFDNSPRSREIIWNFMRLRALRVEVDVKLATGQFTLQQAADYLAASVPMDRGTAQAEASFFAATPGQAISYLIGKVQIQQFLADTQRSQGARFDLQAFQDFLWKNGNVPIALQRQELLGAEGGK
ncbi:MAG TPA: DUF885 family protein [Bryobacteraceae bacterium]|nr:DUF885 family protein [Bryobacteraceae bacterium]